jgi:hypothetical protein
MPPSLVVTLAGSLPLARTAKTGDFAKVARRVTVLGDRFNLALRLSMPNRSRV